MRDGLRGCVKVAWVLMLLVPVSLAAEPWQIPPEHAAKAELLNDAQRAFITSGGAIKIVPPRQLEHALATRSPERLAEFIDDLMAAAQQMGYLPSRDMGAAPLDLNSERFNGPQVTPPELRDFEREPGPFSVHRYLFPKSGVPTFGGAKVAVWPEDLVAGDVDVAIVGVPSDLGSGVRDAWRTPHEMRALNTIATPDVQSLIRPFEVLNVVDYGTFAIDQLSAERSVRHIADMVAETAATGAVPMLIGGDTTIVYPGVKGVADTRGDAAMGLLHLSAHADAERFGDHTISDRQVLFALLEEGVIQGSHTVQVGLRGTELDAATLEWLRAQGVRYHTMAEIRRRGPARTFERVARELASGPDAWFVAVDVSVLAPHHMVAAGRAEVHGLEIDDVTRSLRRVCTEQEVVGFAITDLAMMMDLSRLSVLHANAIVNACLTGMALRKQGIAHDYVHPLARAHGQR